jgi:hypothetical protein
LPGADTVCTGGVKFVFHTPTFGRATARFVQGVVTYALRTCANPKQVPKPRGVRASREIGQGTLKTYICFTLRHPASEALLGGFAQTPS